MYTLRHLHVSVLSQMNIKAVTSCDTNDLLLRFSVENAYIDEKEDACDALGEIAYNIG